MEEVREIELEAWRSTGCVVESEAAGVGAEAVTSIEDRWSPYEEVGEDIVQVGVGWHPWEQGVHAVDHDEQRSH